ncbi:NfeD family protein [Maridesulfovibrio frigidus]|uniref:NfeD family protein n=1 Tax=Maridesulfovibrio frigidus TaxID=340956 RepID=UPI000A8AC446|nr:nodulation protein NfeD [Maridesulfovibrio frigidus]
MLFFKQFIKSCSCMIIACVIITFMTVLSHANDSNDSNVSVLYGQIEGAITPAQVSFIEDLALEARDDEHDLILLRLDTPGGLTSSMRDIVKILMKSPIPICIWVGPDGSHAASAGTFIVAASDVSAMAPGTTIGAASPVLSSGDDLPTTMNTKIKNDLISLITSIAKKRGRNIKWYADAVDKSVTIDAQGAATLNVVDFIAVSAEDFLEQLGARGATIDGKRVKFSKEGYSLAPFDAGFSYSVLSWLLNPQVAYLLLVAGIIGLFFEILNPGAILPGVLGGFSLVTALYAMSILPTNAVGLLLLVFGAVLFILEAFITSYGLLSVAAIISLFIGSKALFRGDEVDQIPLGTILGTVFSFSLFAALVIYLVAKAHTRKPGVGMQSMAGLEGKVLLIDSNKLKVRVRGEIWNAIAEEGADLDVGSKVRVISSEGLTLTVINIS